MVDKAKLPENLKEPRRDNIRRGSFIVGNKQQALSAQFGISLRTKRLQMGITQTELARLAQINRSYLSELEKGKTGISLDKAEKLAKALNCELRDLL